MYLVYMCVYICSFILLGFVFVLLYFSLLSPPHFLLQMAKNLQVSETKAIRYEAQNKGG